MVILSYKISHEEEGRRSTRVRRNHITIIKIKPITKEYRTGRKYMESMNWMKVME